jgi:hypothetical protein
MQLQSPQDARIICSCLTSASASPCLSLRCCCNLVIGDDHGRINAWCNGWWSSAMAGWWMELWPLAVSTGPANAALFCALCLCRRRVARQQNASGRQAAGGGARLRCCAASAWCSVVRAEHYSDWTCRRVSVPFVFCPLAHPCQSRSISVELGSLQRASFAHLSFCACDGDATKLLHVIGQSGNFVSGSCHNDPSVK